MTDTPKVGGHVKPGAAAKHLPPGHEHMKTCPTCHGSGKVPGAVSAIDIAARRA